VHFRCYRHYRPYRHYHFYRPFRHHRMHFYRSCGCGCRGGC
jgi:hypothetical protein